MLARFKVGNIQQIRSEVSDITGEYETAVSALRMALRILKIKYKSICYYPNKDYIVVDIPEEHEHVELAVNIPKLNEIGLFYIGSIPYETQSESADNSNQ